jgi:hypothetical protein
MTCMLGDNDSMQNMNMIYIRVIVSCIEIQCLLYDVIMSMLRYETFMLISIWYGLGGL